MVKDLTIMAVGDTWVGGEDRLPAGAPAVQTLKKRAYLSSCLETVAPVLQRGDFTVGNAEAPICVPLPSIEGKAPLGGAIGIMPPEGADVLKQAGFHAMNVANNHAMDYGGEGLLQTIANLNRVGIAAFGGGRNIHEARKPAILERDGVRLALLGYTSTFVPGTFPAGENKPGVATVAISTSYEIPGNIMYAPGAPPRIITNAKRDDRERMEEDVQKARAKADVVMVYWHWGLPRYLNAVTSGLPMEDALFYVANYQEDMGRAAVDAGADLVVGSHPFRLQGMELYKGGLICYSLALLTMPFSMGANFGEESVILKGYVDRNTKKLTRFALLPLMVPSKTMQPNIVPIGKAGDIIAQLERLSKKYKTRFEIKDDEIAIEPARK